MPVCNRIRTPRSMIKNPATLIPTQKWWQAYANEHRAATGALGNHFRKQPRRAWERETATWIGNQGGDPGLAAFVVARWESMHDAYDAAVKNTAACLDAYREIAKSWSPAVTGMVEAAKEEAARAADEDIDDAWEVPLALQLGRMGADDDVGTSIIDEERSLRKQISRCDELREAFATIARAVGNDHPGCPEAAWACGCDGDTLWPAAGTYLAARYPDWVDEMLAACTIAGESRAAYTARWQASL